MISKKRLVAAIATLPLSVWAVMQLRLPVDAEAMKQAEISVRDAQQEGNSAAVIRAYRRWLEFYPNEPSIQAGIYRAIALASEQDGDADQSRVWRNAADSIDPTAGAGPQTGNPATRGGADKLAAILGAVAQTAQTAQAMRQAFNAASPAAPVPVPAQMFPAQPVGSPGFQPAPVTQPMPGYAPQPQQPQFIPQPGQSQPIPLDALGNPIPQPIQPVQQSQQPQYALQPAQPMQQPQQPQYASQPIQPMLQSQQPQYAPQPAQPMQQPQQPQYASQSPYPQQAQYRQPQQYAPQRAPYAVPAGYTRAQQTKRGDAARSIKVFHDHSRLGDKTYFDPPCGALLVAENGSLTFTPTGGETPLVIQASEILEIRMNTAVAKDAGGFHIVTKKGLYLALAPEGATPEEGRADVDELRKQLGLDQ